MTDENVTREALTWALGMPDRNDEALLGAAHQWLLGDFDACAEWLLLDAATGRRLRYPPGVCARLLRIVYEDKAVREEWVAQLADPGRAAVRGALEASR